MISDIAALAPKAAKVVSLMHIVLLLLCAAQLQAADPPVPAVPKLEHVDSCGDPLPDDAVRRIGSIRFRPGGSVATLIPCHDGKTVIAHGINICACELATGKMLRRFSEPSSCIALSPNDAMLAAAVGERIHLWDVSSGRRLRQLMGHTGEITGLAFSPDGRMLASQGRDSIRLWDVAKGREIASLPQKRQVSIPVRLAFTPDGKRLMVAHRADHTIHIWDVASRRQGHEFTHDEADPVSFAFSTDGSSLAIGNSYGGVGRIALWDVPSGKRVRELDSDREGSIAHAGVVAFSRDGKLLASANVNYNWDGNIRVWERATGELHYAIKGIAQSVAFSPDGKILFAGDHVIRRWDLATGKEIQPPEGSLYHIHALALSPDGRRLASVNRDICLWDTATDKLVRRFALHGELLMGCAFSPDGKRLATASLQNFLRLWDVSTGEEVRSIQTGPAQVTPFPEDPEHLFALAFAPDGKTLATTSRGGTLCLWDARTGKELRRISGLTHNHEYLDTVVFTADSKRVFAAIRSFYGTDVRGWDVGTGDELPKLTAAMNARMHKSEPDTSDFANAALIALSRDGRMMALNREREICVWNPASGGERLRLRGHREPAVCVAFSPDGRLLASCGRTGTIRLWDLATGAELGQCLGQPGDATSLVFSPDGKLLYSACADTSILVWDVPRILRPNKPSE